MKKHIGNLIIKKGDKRDFSELEEVAGYVSVYEGITFTANALTTTRSVYVCKDATFTANALTTTGYVSVHEDATLNVKFLNGINYKIADGEVFIIESEKTAKGIKIYSGFNFNGVKDNVIVKKNTIYLSEKDGFFAHGETIKKSIEDLEFKILSEKLKNEPIKKDTILTIQYYRLLTGACELGVKEWMSTNKIDEGITALELLPILEKTNAYGLEKFKKLMI